MLWIRSKNRASNDPASNHHVHVPLTVFRTNLGSPPCVIAPRTNPEVSTAVGHISHQSLLSLLKITASNDALPSRFSVHFACSMMQSPFEMGFQLNQQEPAPLQVASAVAVFAVPADAGTTNTLLIASTNKLTMVDNRRAPLIRFPPRESSKPQASSPGTSVRVTDVRIGGQQRLPAPASSVRFLGR